MVTNYKKKHLFDEKLAFLIQIDHKIYGKTEHIFSSKRINWFITYWKHNLITVHKAFG